MVNAALSAIASRIQSNQTLTVLPEGVMLNYLSRRTSSVPLMNFMPLEFTLYGEDHISEAFRAHPFLDGTMANHCGRGSKKIFTRSR